MSPALAGEFFTTATTCEVTHPLPPTPPTHKRQVQNLKCFRTQGQSRSLERVWVGPTCYSRVWRGKRQLPGHPGAQTLAEVTFGGSFYHVRLLLTSIFWNAHSSLLDSGPSSASIQYLIDTSKGTSQAKQPTWRGKSPTHQQRDCLKNPLSPFDVAFPVRGHRT